MSKTKDQWIEKTGGFRFGESKEEFKLRVAAIEKIEQKIKKGKATVKDVDELAKLKGVSDYDRG